MHCADHSLSWLNKNSAVGNECLVTRKLEHWCRDVCNRSGQPVGEAGQQVFGTDPFCDGAHTKLIEADLVLLGELRRSAMKTARQSERELSAEVCATERLGNFLMLV